MILLVPCRPQRLKTLSRATLELAFPLACDSPLGESIVIGSPISLLRYRRPSVNRR